MPTSLEDVAVGIATNLAVIPNVLWSAYILSNPAPPVGEVFPGWQGEYAVNYDRAFQRGLDEMPFTVRVMVGTQGDIAAQQNLYAFMSPKGALSVKTAVEANDSLGGLVDDLHVTNMTGFRWYARDTGNPLLGCEWRVGILLTP